jgi:hypothetical protein
VQYHPSPQSSNSDATTRERQFEPLRYPIPLVRYVHQERFLRLPRLLRSKCPNLHKELMAQAEAVPFTPTRGPRRSYLTRSTITPGAITSLTRNVRSMARYGISKQLASRDNNIKLRHGSINALSVLEILKSLRVHDQLSLPEASIPTLCVSSSSWPTYHPRGRALVQNLRQHTATVKKALEWGIFLVESHIFLLSHVRL